MEKQSDVVLPTNIFSDRNIGDGVVYVSDSDRGWSCGEYSELLYLFSNGPNQPTLALACLQSLGKSTFYCYTSLSPFTR